MRLIWNGHSCFTLETAGGTVVVDPYLDGSVPGLAPIRLRADAVYCSHDHRDHGARELVALTGEKPDVAVETIHTWHDDQQGAADRDAGGRPFAFDTVESGPHSCRPVLRQRNLSD